MITAVAGAQGFLGAFLTRRLGERGHQVLALGRSDPLPETPVDVFIDCNGDSRRFWANAHPTESFRANVLSVAERVTAVPAGRYVYMSSIDVYGPGRGDRSRTQETTAVTEAGCDVYGFHKLLAEQIVRFHSPRPLILRLGTLIGPGLKKNPVFDAVMGHPIRQTPDSTLSLVDLDTVDRALTCLVDAGMEGVVNVTGARSVRVAEVLAAVAEILGRPPAGFHAEPLHTDYDIDISRLLAHLPAGRPLPTSEAMLRGYLARIAAGRAAGRATGE